jgi:hypothetical protein
MTMFNRRGVLAAGVVLALGAPAASDPALAQAKPPAAKQAAIKKTFPYLDAYYKIPATERSRFALAYTLQREGGGPPPKVRVWLHQGTAKTEIPVAADGRILSLPTLAQLNSAATISVEKSVQVPLGLSMGLEATARPAREMSAGEIAAAVEQANRGIKRAAGVVRFMVPTLGSAGFVGAGSGEVVMADGRRAPLPVTGDTPRFEPAAWPTARTLIFARTPTRIGLGPAAKPKKR